MPKDTGPTTPQSVRILGTEVIIRDNPGISCDGIYYQYRREIQLRPREQMLDATAFEHEKNVRYNETKRHEILHAFLDLSGLGSYSDDETLVEWLASMFPQIVHVLKNAGCDY